MAKKMSAFEEAFDRNRKAGNKTFTFNGKQYTTELKEEATDKRARAAGANRSQRSEEKVDIPKGAEEAPKASGKDTRGPSNLDRILMGIPGVGGAGYAAYRGAKAMQSAKAAREAAKSGGEVAPALRAEFEAYKRGGPEAMKEARREAAMAERAGAPATPLRSTNATSDTGRRFSAEQEMEAATSAVRGAAARKALAEARTGRSRASEEAKKDMMKGEKDKPSPRARTREKEEAEFGKGGAVKKKGYAKGGVVMANCGASMKPQQKRK
jgi:hypothetical protein